MSSSRLSSAWLHKSVLSQTRKVHTTSHVVHYWIIFMDFLLCEKTWKDFLTRTFRNVNFLWRQINHKRLSISNRQTKNVESFPRARNNSHRACGKSKKQLRGLILLPSFTQTLHVWKVFFIKICHESKNIHWGRCWTSSFYSETRFCYQSLIRSHLRDSGHKISNM